MSWLQSGDHVVNLPGEGFNIYKMWLRILSTDLEEELKFFDYV